ncbi:precorrin-8X methylmutase [Butyrivibrio sp. AE3004]|uniref:precorrin-8X methylmutase n=1 Tax=Butyrivibrio sp. AE3004 TaxID=1506994 RepID=UPI00049434C4|nr:precorrin-8X methylmutase [Butyrivibrio sp. AE3004]
MNFEKVEPWEIEKRSFEIITKELEEAGIIIDEETAFITKRCIHTSADFDYAKTLRFSKDAVETVKELVRNGACIVTDTNMALSGINKKKLSLFGGEAFCFMADEDVALEAKKRGITRAAVSMEKAAKLDRDVIFAIGNAPTALIKLHEMMEKNIFIPNFVIGVPVGFVNVVWAKELFLDSDVPYIINEGRKGGSNIAAAICNAILYDLG